MNIKEPARLLLILFALLELLFVTFWRNAFNPYFSPLILLFCSLMVAFCYLAAVSGNSDASRTTFLTKSLGRSWLGVPLLLFCTISLLLFFKLKTIFAAIPLSEGDSSWSDIIPQIMTLCRRFLRGEMPYAPIEYNGYQLFPTYLPMQWLPYVFAEWLKMDYRWIPAIVLWLFCIHHLIITTLKPKNHSIGSMISALWPLIIWGALIMEDDNLFGITVESLIAGYYLLTANAARTNNLLLLAVGISLTLLSRYAIVFWVPCAFAAIVLKKGWTSGLRLAGIIALAFIIIYWLPFLRIDYHIYAKGYAYHTYAALGEWQHLNENGRPYHLYAGLGIAAWIYRGFINMALSQRLELLQKIHLTASIISVIILFCWYYPKRNTLLVSTFLLFSLKIYLTIFYNFIQIPYKYLFFTPLIITAALLGDAYKSRPVPAS